MERCRHCPDVAHGAAGLWLALILLNSASSYAEPWAVSLRLSGFVQADAYAYRQDSEDAQDQLDAATGQPLNEARFLIRRARLRATAEARFLGGLIEIDGSTVQGAQARLLGAEAWAEWREPSTAVPYLQASMGLFKIPFGREVLQYDPERAFLERSHVIQALFPGEYDLGVRVAGGFRFLRYAIALMNGAPAGDSLFALRDPNRSKDVLGRLGIDVGLGLWGRIRAGTSGLYGSGFSPGTPATKDMLSWRDDNEDGLVQPSELLAIRGRAEVPSQSFTRDALGVDVELSGHVPHLGALQISGELIWARNLDRGLAPADPIGAGRTLRELGYYAAVVQQLTPHAQLGLRYDFYDPDADRQEQQGAQRVSVSAAYASLTVTASALLGRFGRLSCEYQNHRNALGRSASGAPATLGRDVVLVRAQGVF